MIWSSTRHYADFDHQVNILNDHQPLSDMQFERAVQTVTSVILRGIGLEPYVVCTALSFKIAYTFHVLFDAVLLDFSFNISENRI
jgi:hypothetical protein